MGAVSQRSQRAALRRGLRFTRCEVLLGVRHPRILHRLFALSSFVLSLPLSALAFCPSEILPSRLSSSPPLSSLVSPFPSSALSPPCGPRPLGVLCSHLGPLPPFPRPVPRFPSPSPPRPRLRPLRLPLTPAGPHRPPSAPSAPWPSSSSALSVRRSQFAPRCGTFQNKKVGRERSERCCRGAAAARKSWRRGEERRAGTKSGAGRSEGGLKRGASTFTVVVARKSWRRCDDRAA